MVDLFLNDWFSTDIILLDEMEQIENLLVHEFFHNLDTSTLAFTVYLCWTHSEHISHFEFVIWMISMILKPPWITNPHNLKSEKPLLPLLMRCNVFFPSQSTDPKCSRAAERRLRLLPSSPRLPTSALSATSARGVAIGAGFGVAHRPIRRNLLFQRFNSVG